MIDKNQKSDQMIHGIDLFCGAGGLTRGLLNAGINVVAGYDTDEFCRYAYETNNDPAIFLNQDVSTIDGSELLKLYPKRGIRLLAGCAPCQTFSKYTQGINKEDDPRWFLLGEFARLIRETRPEIVSMENVPDLHRHEIYTKFIHTLIDEGYFVDEDVTKHIISCPDYGVPQNRTRLVLLASKLGPIQLIPKTHSPSRQRTVRGTISNLPRITHGESHPSDPLHRASKLSDINMKRIKSSKPGGSWKDWPKDLRAECHTQDSGKAYPSVYGRMEWDKPSPTITTQFFGYGSGRFGHPTQNRGLTLREGAMLQSFPKYYEFVPKGESYPLRTIGRMIGNAVPVRIGKVVGISIKKHLVEHGI